jgi:hypothetical protein
MLHMNDTPVHEWLRPRLRDLVLMAEREGFGREIVVATVIDIMTAPPYDVILPSEGAE